ncbi:hypothetical protein A6A06_08110 [Streptomyces sp. CB02923]|uniref:hypothetical protein n=1 Tax=Streptomyces sp. CB02923 TaxID=1718985 RepID=UPI00094012F5|nr:hypothetical protein [Streptomyces sp. CB02923]OKI04702.1 hypothetical protein A6A06_08110 [Streptomyces sp. CB02923]
MEAVAAIFGLLFLLFVAAGVFVTVKAVKAAKRGVDRGVAQARRTVEDTTLRARQYTQPGVAGELAQLRLTLRTSMRATQDALHTGASEDASLAEALGLFERLSAHGHELDDELKRLEREPDRASVTARLPELRERLERITHSAESLRWAARDRARQFADDDLAALGEQIDMEAGALRHWSKEPLEDRIEASGVGGTVPSGASGADGAGASRRASGASSDGSAGRKPWGSAEGETPAITARDPRTQPSYAWQKAPRTERTT